MKKFYKITALSFVGASFVAFTTTSPAFADNCSGLSDCYGTILAVLLVILAIAFIFALPFILDFLVMRLFFAMATRAALWSLGRGRILAAIGALLGRTLFNFSGNYAGQTNAAINQGMAAGQRNLLTQLFGKGVPGAQQAWQSGTVPPGLTPDTLMRYHELARRAIDSGLDKSGVQIMRMQIVERILRSMGITP